MATTVLLTNDDGIHAPGLMAFEKALSALPDVDLWVVAPDRERSTCSHGMTIARPIFAKAAGHQRLAVEGLPADCVYFAMFGPMPRLPDVVVSGINAGANLGCDVIYSGTVAAAREATVLGVHGLSVSLVAGNEFDLAAENADHLAMALARHPGSPARLLNVNYPEGSFTGPRLAPLGARNYPRVVEARVAELTGEPYYWLGGPAIKDDLVPGTDGWLVSRGEASATWLTLDQTHPEMNSVETPGTFGFLDSPVNAS